MAGFLTRPSSSLFSIPPPARTPGAPPLLPGPSLFPSPLPMSPTFALAVSSAPPCMLSPVSTTAIPFIFPPASPPPWPLHPTCVSSFAAMLLKLTLMPRGSRRLSSKRVRPWLATFWQMMLMGGRPDSSNSLRMLSCRRREVGSNSKMAQPSAYCRKIYSSCSMFLKASSRPSYIVLDWPSLHSAALADRPCLSLAFDCIH